MNINLKQLANLGQLVLIEEGSDINRTLRFGKALCIPVEPYYGNTNVTIPLVISTSEDIQYVGKNEAWLCIENNLENLKDFEFPSGLKEEMLTQAIKQDNAHVYPATQLAKDERLLEELHNALLNELISIGFSFQQEPDESGVEVKIVRQIYILPTDLVPLGVYVVEKRSINDNDAFYYVYPLIFSMNYLPRHISFPNINEVIEYYKTETSIEVGLGNQVRRLLPEEVLSISNKLNN